MEQWVSDGRTIIDDRGRSHLPPTLESEGFVEDLTGTKRGLLKRVVVHGTGDAPLLYASCYCRFAYINRYGQVVDQNDDHDEPLEVIVGAGQVTQGFDEGLLSMRTGEEAEFWLDPAFAFRENGCRGTGTGVSTSSRRNNIEPDDCVLLRLTLCSFDNPMGPEATLVKVDELKEKGNEAFRLQQWDVALRQYHAALRHASAGQVWSDRSLDSSLMQRRGEVASVLCTNISAVWFAKDDMSVTLQFITRALRWNPRNAKALFRRLLVLERRLEFAEAIRQLNEMRVSQLGDSTALDEVEKRILEKDSTQSGAQKKMFQKMF